MAQKICSLHFLNPDFSAFKKQKTLNCHNYKTVRAVELIPTLRARPQYQVSYGSLVVEDYTQQNRWDYTQQNCDWAAIESFKSNLWVLIVKKVVLSKQKTQVFHRSVATNLSKNAGSLNRSLASLNLGKTLVQKDSAAKMERKQESSKKAPQFEPFRLRKASKPSNSFKS